MKLSEIEKQREAIVSAAHHQQLTAPLANPTHQARALNRFCGDEIQVYFEIKDDALNGACAQVKGCLVTQAAWNLLAPLLIGQTVASAVQVVQSLLDALSTDSPTAPAPLQILLAFQHPSPRKRCASLAAEATLSALLAVKSY